MSDYPREASIHELFEQQAQGTPDAPAVVFTDGSLTYAELNSRANQLAHYLKANDVQPGMLVGFCLERTAAAITALLAILKAGAAYLPLDPTYPVERLGLMIEDARIPVLLTTRQLLNNLPTSKAHVIVLDELQDQISQQSTENPAHETQGHDLAYVIYTSGSTGPPKGICIPHRAVNRLVINTNYIDLGPGARIAQASNTSFDAAIFEIWGALLNGACSVGIKRDASLSPRHLVEEIRRQQINVLFLTTALFNQVARELPDGFSSLRELLFGGEAVDPEMVRRVLLHGAPKRLLHVYGPTENTTFSSWYLVESVPENASTIPIGTAISNTEIFVVDELLRPVKPGEEGELYLGGDGLADGYLDRPDVTARAFIRNPFDLEGSSRLYKTGDVGRVLVDGNIEFVGRVDNQIKLRGFRIELEEIEAALTGHPSVVEAAIVVHFDCIGDKSLVAYMVAQPGETLSVSEIREYLKQRLPEHMVPAGFATVEAMPLTPNGKIDRGALATIQAIRPKLDTQYVEPSAGLESSIAAVWRDILHVENVGAHDNFFELGGHSLSIARAHSRLAYLLGPNTPVTVMFQHPTVSSLAKYLGTKLNGGEEPRLLDRVKEQARKQRGALAQRKRSARV